MTLSRTRILALALVAGWTAHSARAQDELELPALIEEALAQNPSLSVLRHRWAAEEARIPQAGALMDPMFKFELSNVPLSDFDFDSSPMSGKQLMLSQKLPYWGKRADRERMAGHTAAAAEASYLDREGIIVNQVKQAYFTLSFLDRAIAITEDNQHLLQDFVRIAQTKYAVGTGRQQDVLKAQVSLSSLRDRLIILRQQRRHAEARLNTALNRLPQAAVGHPGPVAQTAFDYTVEDLQERALDHRPQLRGIQETIRKWEVAEALARRGYRPDFDLSLGYRQRDFARDPVAGSDFFSVGVMMNLPVYQGRKQDQQVLEARLRRETAAAQYETMKQQIFLQLQQLYVDIQTHREQAELFDTAIIPQADQSLNAALAGYQVDKVDFLTLLDNQVKLFNFEIAYHRHRADYEKYLAELEAVVGERLFQ